MQKNKYLYLCRRKNLFLEILPWLQNFKLNIELLTLNKNDTNFKIIILDFNNTIQFQFTNHIQIYTDAFKSEQEVNFAIVLNQMTIQHKLPDVKNIFTSETLPYVN